MLHAPDRIEAQWFGKIAELQLRGVNIMIGPLGIGRLKDHAHSDMHGIAPYSISIQKFKRGQSRLSCTQMPASVPLHSPRVLDRERNPRSTPLETISRIE